LLDNIVAFESITLHASMIFLSLGSASLALSE